jgi:group I intron endonuclease
MSINKRLQKNRYGCIYVIQNHINGKMYVGQHNKKNVSKRWGSHKQRASKENPEYIIHKAMKKYGITNFTIDILCIVPYSALDIYEIYFADLLNVYVWNKRGYNTVLCGGGGGGREITEETRQRLRDSHKGKKQTQETIAKRSKAVSEWAQNNPDLVASKSMKVSQALKGKSNANWGSHTLEANAKISSTLSGSPKTEEHNIKVSSSKYHSRGGKLGEKYIQQNSYGFYVRINNKRYGQFEKQFKTLDKAKEARDTFIKRLNK